MEPETTQILLQYQENALTLTKERLQKTMEGFCTVAEEPYGDRPCRVFYKLY